MTLPAKILVYSNTHKFQYIHMFHLCVIKQKFKLVPLIQWYYQFQIAYK